MSSVKFFAFGNPLLDISAEVKPSLLEEFSLLPDNAILAEPAHAALYTKLVEEYPVEYVPGGSALNTARVAQFYSGDSPTATTTGYMGAVGADANGDILREKAESEGLFLELAQDSAKATGKCAALVTGGKRSLVADLQAAESFSAVRGTVSELDTVLGGAKEAFGASKVVYTTSFVLTHSAEAALTLAKGCAEQGKLFAMNLSAPFLMEVPPFFAAVKNLLPYADYVFCNETEAAALIKAMEWKEGDLAGAAKLLHDYTKANDKQGRTVIFTRGGEPAIVCDADGSMKEYAPIPLKEGQLVDENGAGDAYLGGFMAAIVDGKSLEEAFALGSYAAYVVIQQHGCKLVAPDQLPAVEHMGYSFPPSNVTGKAVPKGEAKRQRART